MHRSPRYLPELLAAAVTLLNAAKPVVVDDTAYLLFARHLAADPTHPYAFALFWNDAPQPAMEILLPPVVPMWLALGIRLFGEHVVPLKLWLFAFLWLFTRSVWYLLGVFAPRERVRGSVLFAFSPAVLPLVNFMLDIPAVALGLAATACLVHAGRGGRWGWVAAAGVLGAAAAQTKYTMLVLPAVWCWYGVTHKSPARALAACAGGVLLFAAWELFVDQRCGESHFLYHLRHQGGGGAAEQAGTWDKLDRWASGKCGLAVPLLSYLGALGAGWAVFAAPAAGVPRRLVHGVLAFGAVGMVAVLALPAGATDLLREPDTGRVVLTLPGVVFVGLGGAALPTVAAVVAGFLTRRRGAGVGPRRSRAGWFLAGWLAVEVAGYFVLTPFPAGRRVVMPAVVFGLAACAWVSRTGRIRGHARPTRPAVAYCLAVGFGLYALDTWDAAAEPAVAREAVASIQPSPGRLWSRGHWGWQYAIDRAGGRLVEPGASKLRAGDWLILPVPPDEDGLHRPYHGEAVFMLDESKLRFVRRIVRDDLLSGSTVPTLYGGHYPVVGRDYPRLVVEIYRVTADWVPQPPAAR